MEDEERNHDEEEGVDEATQHLHPPVAIRVVPVGRPPGHARGDQAHHLNPTSGLNSP